MLLLPAFVLSTMALRPSTELSLIPRPVSWKPGDGVLTLDGRTAVVASGAAEPVARRLQEYLRPATGFPLRLSTGGGSNAIHLWLNSRLGRLGREGYRLEVKSDRVDIQAAEPAGLFYGVQTLRQMLPTAIFRKGRVDGVAWTIPQGTIEDYPRFLWRGGHLDVGRHFFPKEFLLKFIDLLALHKLNTFHLHLTEDQGWRIEIKRYPKLTQVGAWRKDSMLTYDPPKYEGKPHGGFYTQEDLREVVAYARERFIDVVPEIEMPGHSQAAIAAYPELGNTGEPVPVETRWGVIEHVYNVDDATLKFLQNVLDEVLEIFPSTFIHLGGDECPKEEWKKSPAAQEKMKKLGLKNEEELQSWFVRQMDAYLASKGRRLVGWDEILEGGLAPGATVMSWRGEAGGIASAKSGHDVVMAPGDWTYFDHYQSKDRSKEPHAIGGFTDVAKVYGYEPVPAALTSEEAKHVLGSQFQLWSEYFPDAKHVEYMAFPRACAFSEVAWSPKSGRNYENFSARLPFHLDRLTALDVNYRKLDPGSGTSADKPVRPSSAKRRHARGS